jgi:hypothetical protein
MESSGRAHSVPRPAFGGAMLTLLRVRRVARLRRRPELDGASRPLHRAGSWQPSSCECKGRPRGRQARARVGSCSFPNPTSSPYWAARRGLQRAEATAPIAQLEEPIIRNDGGRGSNPSCGTSNKSRQIRTLWAVRQTAAVRVFRNSHDFSHVWGGEKGKVFTVWPLGAGAGRHSLSW